MANDIGREEALITKDALPHSAAEHNPMWCKGDMDGLCVGDDPCWACIAWAFEHIDPLQRRDKLARAEGRWKVSKPEELVADVEHILEYWNGNANERAMHDALEEILATAEKMKSKLESALVEQPQSLCPLHKEPYQFCLHCAEDMINTPLVVQSRLTEEQVAHEISASWNLFKYYNMFYITKRLNTLLSAPATPAPTLVNVDSVNAPPLNRLAAMGLADWPANPAPAAQPLTGAIGCDLQTGVGREKLPAKPAPAAPASRDGPEKVWLLDQLKRQLPDLLSAMALANALAPHLAAHDAKVWAEALEEAAKLCESKPYFQHVLAKAIRDLSAKPGPNGGGK